jgi:hypothetical protein
VQGGKEHADGKQEEGECLMDWNVDVVTSLIIFSNTYFLTPLEGEMGVRLMWQV